MTAEDDASSSKSDVRPVPDPRLLETACLAQQGIETKALNAGANPLVWIGRMLGRYQITGLLGRGGMGVVLKAYDPLIERDVAIKLLCEELAEDETSLSRFLAEAKAAGKLNHPNIVSIYEIGQHDGACFLVMELIPGGSVAVDLDQGSFSVIDATRIMMDACKGIAAAHDAGLIHRDIKPANLLRTADGSIKITDFGLAKTTSPRLRELTQSGLVVGTPYFMSPEQCEAKAVDARSDIYSLGATYYSLLTGKNPYQDSDSVVQVMFGHCQGEIPDPRDVNSPIPSACSVIIARAMAKAPVDRYQSAREMLADLQAVAEGLTGTLPIALPSRSGTREPFAALGASPKIASPKRTALRWIAAGALVATAILMTAYWASWRGSGNNPSLPPVNPGAAAAPVKVGVLHSLSGTMATSEAPVVDAVLMAFDEVNQNGGVLGRPVEPVVADGRSDPAIFAREAERLISQEKTCAVFGCWTSASRKTVKPIFEMHDHLLVYPVQFEGLETSPSIIYLGAAPNQQIVPAIDWAMMSLGKKRFFLVGSDYVFPRVANAIIKDHLQRKRGQVVGEKYAPLGCHDFTAIAADLAAAKPDMILNTINGDSNLTFFRALRAAGVTSANTPTVSFSVDEQVLRGLNPAQLAGDYGAWSYFQSVATAENLEFVRRFHAKYPHRTVTDPMETAYAGVKLWAKAVNDVHSLDPKKVRRVMLSERVAAPSGEVRIEPDSHYSYSIPRIGQIQSDGRFKVVWTAPAAVRPNPYPNSRTAEAWRDLLHDLYTGWGNSWAAPEDNR